MVLFLFLAKPALYLLVFAASARFFARFGPHGELSTAWRVILATLTRLGLGAAGVYFVAVCSGALQVDFRPMIFFPILFVLGAGFWLGCLKVAFGRSPWSALIVAALLAELMSIAIDIPATQALRAMSFC